MIHSSFVEDTFHSVKIIYENYDITNETLMKAIMNISKELNFIPLTQFSI